MLIRSDDVLGKVQQSQVDLRILEALLYFNIYAVQRFKLEVRRDSTRSFAWILPRAAQGYHPMLPSQTKSILQL